ncbi:MAG: hypothetical protein M3R13_00765 [Armatimonadota bacterium]|nr:hypothetical protein [Armatimonadota bacterium]
MEELIKNLADRVGISEEQAAKVVEFLREHMDELPQMLNADSDMFKSMSAKLQGFIGDTDEKS